MSGFCRIDVNEVLRRIAGKDVLVLCHMNPDADTVGSALALCDIVKMAGGTAKAVCDTKFPERLLFMCGEQTGVYSDGDEDGKVVISVDVASVQQLGRLGFLAKKTELMIDHHAFGEVYADYLKNPEASSVGEIVTGIYKTAVENGIINESADTCRRLYAAISSDTGSFKYSNATAKTFTCAAYLVEKITADCDGMETAEISRLLFDTKTLKELVGQRLAMERVHMYLGGKLAICTVSKADFENAGITAEDMADIIDVPRSIRGVEVAVSLKEKTNGLYRVSTRSNTDFNVAEVCARFGGGGHNRAAGASVEASSAEDAEWIMAEAFTEAMEKING